MWPALPLFVECHIDHEPMPTSLFSTPSNASLIFVMRSAYLLQSSVFRMDSGRSSISFFQ
jgi:hypothetical protein